MNRALPVRVVTVEMDHQQEVPAGFVQEAPQPEKELPVIADDKSVIVKDSGASVSFATTISNPAVFVSEEHIRAMQKQKSN